ncbi:MAG: hypothetical protein IJH63_10385 [Methanobrevibacter sp.]|nr:hypothetical protein [Methanosphaera sp.]MBR0371107.1 hypothetical protein [Methanobrevibacter sp.]
MVFEEWNNDTWKVQCINKDEYTLKTPSSTCVFNKHDFIELYRNLGYVAESCFDGDEWYIHDSFIVNRRTGEQLIGIVDECFKFNELTEKIKELEESYKKEVIDKLYGKIEEVNNRKGYLLTGAEVKAVVNVLNELINELQIGEK